MVAFRLVASARLSNQLNNGFVITVQWVKIKMIQNASSQKIFIITAGPQEDPDECGTPVLCIFYALLLCIVCLTAYTTLKGSLK